MGKKLGTSQGLVDVRDHTTTRDGSLDRSAMLFITADSELEMTRSYSLHLEVLAGFTGELQDLSGQVLEVLGTSILKCSTKLK